MTPKLSLGTFVCHQDYETTTRNRGKLGHMLDDGIRPSQHHDIWAVHLRQKIIPDLLISWQERPLAAALHRAPGEVHEGHASTQKGNGKRWNPKF